MSNQQYSAVQDSAAQKITPGFGGASEVTLPKPVRDYRALKIIYISSDQRSAAPVMGLLESRFIGSSLVYFPMFSEVRPAEFDADQAMLLLDPWNVQTASLAFDVAESRKFISRARQLQPDLVVGIRILPALENHYGKNISAVVAAYAEEGAVVQVSSKQPLHSLIQGLEKGLEKTLHAKK